MVRVHVAVLTLLLLVLLLLLCDGSGLVPALWVSVSSCCDVDDDRADDDVNTWFDDGARPRDDSATATHTQHERTQRPDARFR